VFRFVDSDNDPHDATKGLWYSHIGWIFERRKYSKARLINLSDLDADPSTDIYAFKPALTIIHVVVLWQHRLFVPFALFSAFIAPSLICHWAWGDFLGGFLYGGFVLRVLIWHGIFSINSLAHYVGTQEFSQAISARGNWLLAFLTCGEGHHNFHHEFPTDYRNGIKWYDYDPTKWAIDLASKLGLVTGRKSTRPELIEKARMLAKAAGPVKELVWPKMSLNEFKSRCQTGDKLVIIEGWVLDLAGYMAEHPGGRKILEEFVGKDATAEFNGEVNVHSQAARILAKECRIAQC